jgi:hypothetical protein
MTMIYHIHDSFGHKHIVVFATGLEQYQTEKLKEEVFNP